MSRKRTTNKGLPRRVYLKNGAYRFLSPVPIRDPRDGILKQWIHLAYKAEGESVMFAALSVLLDDKAVLQNGMPYLVSEFRASKLARYSKEVQSQYRQYLTVIAHVFEDFDVVQVTTKLCADFIRASFRDKHNTARKYAGLMYKLFKFAISELGLREDNPIAQLDLSDYAAKRRTILPTHAQITEIRAASLVGADGRPTSSGRVFCCLVDMSYLCWQRAIDIRTLKESQIDGDYIRFEPSKTLKSSGKKVDIFITPQIREVINRAQAIKKEKELVNPYLFPTRKKLPYTGQGLSSMWDRALERTNITDNIVFKDLRALGATDAAKAGEKMADIQMRLAHTSSKTSEIYIKESVPGTSHLESQLPW